MNAEGISVEVSPGFAGELQGMFVGKFLITSLFFGAIVGAYFLVQKYPIAAALIYPACAAVLVGIATGLEHFCEPFFEQRLNSIARGNFIALGEMAVLLSKLKSRTMIVGMMCGIVIGGLLIYLAIKLPLVWEGPQYGDYKLDTWFYWTAKGALVLLGIVAFIYLSNPWVVKHWLSRIMIVLMEGDQNSHAIYELADDMLSRKMAENVWKCWNLHVNWTLVCYMLFAIWAFFNYLHRLGELLTPAQN